MDKISWDDYFMTMVYLVAMRSKDKSTHIGAVVVGSDKEVRSVGYNGFPRGMDDDNLDRQRRPNKYFFFEHAERNSIYNANLIGISLKGCIMYTNGIPCADCARGIIQVGIKEVVVDKQWNEENADKWAESAKKSMEMFNECDVKIRHWDGNLLDIYKYRNEQSF